MGIIGNRDGLSNMPDGKFQKGVAMRCPEYMLKRGVERLKARGRRDRVVAQRKAILTEKHASGRALCHYCGHCMAGCEVDLKYTFSEYADSARAAKRQADAAAGIHDDADCHGRGWPQTQGDRVYRRGGAEERSAVPGAGAGVQRRRERAADAGGRVGNSSGEVGKNLTSHFGLTVAGMFPELKGRDLSNDDGTDYYHSLLTGMYWDRPNPKFDGTYQVQCGAGMQPLRLAVRNVPGWGAGFKRDLRQWNAAHAWMNMQGSLLVSQRKYVDLDPVRKDKNGVPIPRPLAL